MPDISGVLGTLSDQVFSAAVGAALTGVMAVAARLFSRRHGRRRLEAVTGFDLSERPLAVVGVPLRAEPGTTRLTPQVDGLPLFGYGPFVSYATLATRLLRVRSHGSPALPDIVISSQYQELAEDQKRGRDLILLGYPAGNEATRVLEPTMRLPIAFASDKRRAIVNIDTAAVVGEAQYEKSPDNTVRTVRDCGLLVRVQHPLNSAKAILYLAGCETFGVKIAADAVTPESIPEIFGLGRIAAATWRHRWLPALGLSRVASTDYVAVFVGDVQHLVTGTPKLVLACTRSRIEGSPWKQTYPRSPAA